jgi:hypothetical protein
MAFFANIIERCDLVFTLSYLVLEKLISNPKLFHKVQKLIPFLCFRSQHFSRGPQPEGTNSAVDNTPVIEPRISWSSRVPSLEHTISSICSYTPVTGAPTLKWSTACHCPDDGGSERL